MNIHFRKALGLTVLTAALVAAMTPSLPASAAGRDKPYVFTSINFTGANVTIANGINSRGAVVGNYVLPNSTQNHGFILSDGKYSTIDYPGGVSSTIAQGISPAGDIVGSYGLNGKTHGFLVTKQGEWSTVDYPSGNHTMQGGLMRILPDGTVVGCYHDGNPASAMWGYVVSKNGTTSSFSYPDGAPYSMHYGATPDGKTFVGMYRTGRPKLHGYLLSDGKLISIDVPRATMTQALDINGAGEVIGMYTDSNGKTHGFSVKTRGVAVEHWRFTTIDFPGATSTIVRGINAGGDLVGNYVDAGGKTYGFLASLSKHHDSQDRDGTDRNERHADGKDD